MNRKKMNKYEYKQEAVFFYLFLCFTKSKRKSIQIIANEFEHKF